MELNIIKKRAEELLQNTYGHVARGLGDHYYHGQRVGKMSITLRKMVLPDNDLHDDILTVASWFHDIAKGKPEHARFGAAMAREALREYCTSSELNEIAEIILLHSKRNHPEYSEFIKIHQDADLLDHFGTYNAWMTFAHNLYESKANLIEIAEYELTHYDDVSTHFCQMCNYDVSRRICDEKINYWQDFIRRLKIEASGEFWIIP